MHTIQRWWRTTLGKIIVILAGGLSSIMICCVGLLVLVAAANPSAPAARSIAGARTAVVQQVADTMSDESRSLANPPTTLPSDAPLAVAANAPPATTTSLSTHTPQPTAAPTAIPTTTPPAPTSVPQGQITQAVNMRAGPSAAFAVKQTVQAGATAELLSVRTEDGTPWYEVRINGDIGWMSGAVIEVAPEQAALLPVNTARFVPPTPVRAPQPVAPAPQEASQNCDPSYPDVCIPPKSQVGDLNCGDIPYRRFRVIGADPHRFDRDHDGIGCESS